MPPVFGSQTRRGALVAEWRHRLPSYQLGLFGGSPLALVLGHPGGERGEVGFSHCVIKTVAFGANGPGFTEFNNSLQA